MNDPRLRRHPLGFLEVVDRPSPEELSDYYARTYYQTERSSFRGVYPLTVCKVSTLRFARRAEQAIQLLGRDRPGRLLDVGCGEGFLLKAFAARGWDVAGVDFSIAGVESMNPDVADRIQQGDIFALLEARIAAGETFDLVWLGNVLEHVLDPVGLMRKLRDLVDSWGVLVTTVPNDGNLYHEDLFTSGLVDRRFWIAIPDHMSYFTAGSLRATADATGWDTLAMLGDFPIDLFLAHEGSNYIGDRKSTRLNSSH